MTDFDDQVTNPSPSNQPHPPDVDGMNDVVIDQDPIFQKQVQRLHRLTVYSRWLMVALLWLFLAPLCLWVLRSELALWFDYFTWTAVRYTIVYNRLPTFGIILCIAATVSLLVWQSRTILWGIPKEDLKQLEKKVLRIRRQGASHPLWKWVCDR